MGQCSVSCGGGIQRQRRLCLIGLSNDIPNTIILNTCDSYELERTIPCNMASCPSPGEQWRRKRIENLFFL